MKRTILWITVIVGVVFIVWAMVAAVKKENQPVGNATVSGSEAGVLASDWVKGPRDGKVVLIKYSDFQCPGCKSYDLILREVVAEQGDNLTFVYRHYPLSTIHPNADLAARASEAAGKQGKFWEMHDILFDTQETWATRVDAIEIFKGYARDLGLNAETFAADLNNIELRRKVNEDYKMGLRAGVMGTPTFYLNGKLMPGVRSVEEFKAIINDAVTANK